MKVTFFPNGMTMTFENEEQVPEAQQPWILVFAEYLKAQGIDPAAIEFELPLGATAKIFQTEDGYNFECLN